MTTESLVPSQQRNAVQSLFFKAVKRVGGVCIRKPNNTRFESCLMTHCHGLKEDAFDCRISVPYGVPGSPHMVIRTCVYLQSFTVELVLFVSANSITFRF
jgi:hypothetical protein